MQTSLDTIRARPYVNYLDIFIPHWPGRVQRCSYIPQDVKVVTPSFTSALLCRSEEWVTSLALPTECPGSEACPAEARQDLSRCNDRLAAFPLLTTSGQGARHVIQIILQES